MGPWGAIIMGFFGGVFFAFGTTPLVGWPSLWLLIPVAVFAAVAFAAVPLIRRDPAGVRPPPAVERAIGRATLFEAVAIPATALLLGNTGRETFVTPAIALIVGLHFLPIARASRRSRFWWLGLTLMAAAAVSLLLPLTQRTPVAGLAAALALWIAAVWALRPLPAAEPDSTR